MMDKNEAETVIKETIAYANEEIRKNKRKTRRILISVIIIATLLISWLLMGFVDYVRVSNYEKPLFCFSREAVYRGAEDYRHCQGLGYSFEITVADPQEGQRGLKNYSYFIFGKEIYSDKKY